MKNETVLKDQKKNLELILHYKWVAVTSRPMIKTMIISASPFLLDFYRMFRNVYFGEQTRLITVMKQLLKNNDKLPQNADDNLTSQISCLGLPLTLFHSSFDKYH